MFIANDGTGTRDRGDYVAAVCRRGSEEPPRELYKGQLDQQPKATRVGRVSDYPRLAYNVWRLITRSLLAAFPEERASNPKNKTQLTEQIVWGLQQMRNAADNPSKDDWIVDRQAVAAAQDWLDAAKSDKPNDEPT